MAPESKAGGGSPKSPGAKGKAKVAPKPKAKAPPRAPAKPKPALSDMVASCSLAPSELLEPAEVAAPAPVLDDPEPEKNGGKGTPCLHALFALLAFRFQFRISALLAILH